MKNNVSYQITVGRLCEFNKNQIQFEFKGDTDMKYYLHDSNAYNDEKITELFINYGYEGLGLFYTILEKIAFQEKPIKTSILKSQLKVGKRLEKCWSFMEIIGLIQSINGETFNIELMNFSGKYAIKKEKNAKKVSEWRVKQVDIKNVTGYEPICNPYKVKKSKVKESKELEDKSEIPILTQNENFIQSIQEIWQPVVKKWLDYKKEKKQPYNSLTSLNTMFEKLKKFSYNDPKIAIEIIENSIANNYSGFFKIKEHTNKINVYYQSNDPVKNF